HRAIQAGDLRPLGHDQLAGRRARAAIVVAFVTLVFLRRRFRGFVLLGFVLVSAAIAFGGFGGFSGRWLVVPAAVARSAVIVVIIAATGLQERCDDRHAETQRRQPPDELPA